MKFMDFSGEGEGQIFIDSDIYLQQDYTVDKVHVEREGSEWTGEFLFLSLYSVEE